MERKDFLNEFEYNTTKDVETMFRKNKDYAGEEDAFKNFRRAEDLGLCNVETAIMVRMCDKFQRIINLLDKEEPDVLDESIKDSLSDLRNYANILEVYLKYKKGEEDGE